ncbi:hypothetical protein EV361DRAFT_946639 [Lentinula raphanica]|uniref:Hypervirulence associated protein TUDOR domain-containing protein n=1 Tax=Lentinula raphanica TaxID=153919 RepID=A0AA38PHW1_9AGAR|nr:hypothetical protein C8R42DRAFT_718004 [Lentinula raphanica]KAJ3757285.1 hypothetical protein EV360DRAFT_84167 [Lentinula raphanica]KAJ3822078.1 hypothetical protein F5880DRAFT_728152 [Lentinula raphanica]KAJ3843213.1 hypothetical protein F5878DRAFT_605581 [Lentinula raphanica]KAJ3974856.1 hypothetical protein EV361DRAFT_946639 [Lentinula raphanica]
MSQNNYNVGDRVEYQGIGGGNVGNSTTHGEITDIITEKQPAGSSGNTVNASEQDPRFVIRNDNTGKETAYKSENIKGQE